jgi:CDP-diacylglycerol--serine O-phosphatidyltransferase
MKPRFAGHLGVADVVTVANATLGFLAAFVATLSPELAARLLLMASIADALDGILARRFGGTAAGEYLDALADVSSFAVAPAVLVGAVVVDAWGYDAPTAWLGVAVAGLYVAMAVTRLGLYTAYDSDIRATEGTQTTLAATVLAAGVLAGFVDPAVLVVSTAILAVLMVSTVRYPDLHAQDAAVMGLVQAATVFTRGWLGRGFAFALLFLSVAYLLLGPAFYWSNN